MLSIGLILTPILVVAAVAWITIWAQSRLGKRLEQAEREFQAEINRIETADHAAAMKFVDDLTKRNHSVDQALREYQTDRPTILPTAGECPKPYDWGDQDLARWRQANWAAWVGRIRREIGRPVLLMLVIVLSVGLGLECALWHLQGTRRIANAAPPAAAAPAAAAPAPGAPGFDPFAAFGQPPAQPPQGKQPPAPVIPPPVTPPANPPADPTDDPTKPNAMPK